MQDFIDKFNKLTNFQKGLVLMVILFLIATVYFFMGYLPKQDEIKRLKAKKDKSEVNLAEKRAIADNLPKFKEEVARLDEELQKKLKQLPDKAEIPKILRTISNLGKKVGLEFSLFQPGADQPRDFYAEVPLSIRVTGNYHQVALFFDKISQLNRIVNVKNISLTSPKKGGGKTIVTTSATLVTYRFLETKPNPKKK